MSQRLFLPRPWQVYLASRLLEVAQPELSRLSLGPILSQLRSSMGEETNLLSEARHLQEFSDFLDRAGLRSLATCPYIYRQYSSKRCVCVCVCGCVCVCVCVCVARCMGGWRVLHPGSLLKAVLRSSV